MSDAETLAVYDERADDYAKLTNATPDTQLRAFLDKLPQGSRLLDLGCGPGQSAMFMASEGHDVEATDASAKMVELASRHNGVKSRQASFDDLQGDRIYHGIWANFSLLHARREDLPRHLAAISNALKPGGIFHIGMKTGTDMRRDKIGRRYTYVSRSELENLLLSSGMTPFQDWEGEDLGLDGEMAPWIVIQAYKND